MRTSHKRTTFTTFALIATLALGGALGGCGTNNNTVGENDRRLPIQDTQYTGDNEVTFKVMGGSPACFTVYQDYKEEDGKLKVAFYERRNENVNECTAVGVVYDIKVPTKAEAKQLQIEPMPTPEVVIEKTVEKGSYAQ
ncbi:hypothetical protein BK816_02345 [Boudabousia tangfeifanii]|uniref:Uncharacterized protein n=1 Tax=Boudabousia tangfeifanii TaxID=1912795 RepID=A0A1D9MJB4_9ACTO|nr:hypothetical protein [Boudabousia tangfeifanii]AOZ72283.1 hypothetical protein BK816_02345 [Boudabousia tangfeifanii]